MQATDAGKGPSFLAFQQGAAYVKAWKRTQQPGLPFILEVDHSINLPITTNIRVLSGSVGAYAQDEIDDLISRRKTFSEAPRRELKIEGAHARNDAKLVAENVSGEFRMFMRRSEDFPENFSIGLVYQPTDGSGEITLLRCNGKHGEYRGTFDPDHPHYDFHIHKADAAIMATGCRPEKNAAKTLEYA
ncbi:hypothetical protein H7849_20835 [Alloacidobacterium dinghuense]|uniref:Uncharacterized protein n=1 Tax=Alloacidobacterium dinghuense TaxID=2763107 RepID=A0A7G8BG26_9BACT|nr:hypothetical protein [Alloacidobacterium dinghuense]QNI31496.1 hypothetical protein H7849_20835 [Alloacidobacterium dinghuense]